MSYEPALLKFEDIHLGLQCLDKGGCGAIRKTQRWAYRAAHSKAGGASAQRGSGKTVMKDLIDIPRYTMLPGSKQALLIELLTWVQRNEAQAPSRSLGEYLQKRARTSGVETEESESDSAEPLPEC